jgi:hypothetical protein
MGTAGEMYTATVAVGIAVPTCDSGPPVHEMTTSPRSSVYPSGRSSGVSAADAIQIRRELTELLVMTPICALAKPADRTISAATQRHLRKYVIHLIADVIAGNIERRY